MFFAVLNSMLLGFSISAVPGTVFFETIRRTIQNKSSIASYLIGNFTGVAILALLSILGVELLLSSLAIEKLFYGVSSALLLVIGLSSIRHTPKIADETRAVSLNHKIRAAFLVGLILAIANPISIIFWISIVGTFSHDTVSISHLLVLVLSVIIGAVLCFLLLVTAVNRMQKLLKPSFTNALSKISGFIIIVYGLAIAARLI